MDTQQDEVSIEKLATQHFISIDYSDEDIIIIDNIREFAKPSATRIRMNMIVFAIRGFGQVFLNGQPVRLSASQLLLCAPNTIFDDFMTSPDFEFKAVFLTNKIIQSFLREKMNIWNDTMYVHKTHVVTMTPDDLRFFSCFYEALRISIDTPTERTPYRTDVIQGLLRSALLGLCGALRMMLPEEGMGHSTKADSLFQRFLDLVSKSRSKSQTVEEYASMLCVSPKYLTVVCKKNSGKTANEWIQEHMREEIRYYLRQTDLTMKQIADQLGFATPSFFGKYVKQHFGMTPTQFRQK